ncbi:hypothetical protein Purlil1_7102 [Purpureocillium lilacinum]|uniref:Uncharacterized protein n=1 Tax=Purpureocillium lilacinum TaxID=33203 RepID=A0ABR0BXG6_PURLI|nr:hypothetical protein Purlil1_7102 [Purpureocillium lilacinum]
MLDDVCERQLLGARGCAVARSPEQGKSFSAEAFDGELCENDDDYARKAPSNITYLRKKGLQGQKEELGQKGRQGQKGQNIGEGKDRRSKGQQNNIVTPFCILAWTVLNWEADLGEAKGFGYRDET